MRTYLREDLAWASGLFDGEGTIVLSKLPSGKQYPRLKLKMADKDVVERFALVFGFKVRSVTKDKSWQNHWKDQWSTDACGSTAYAALVMMYPWFGSRRKARTEEVISLWKNTCL